MEWDERLGWRITVAITIDSGNEELVPAKTNWSIYLDEQHPYGTIDFYPAVEGGLAGTFAHQNYNGLVIGDRLSGNICIKAPQFVFRRDAYDADPIGHKNRLAWYIEKAVEWLTAASQGKLLDEGDYFELPVFYSPKMTDHTIATNENADSFALWQSATQNYGSAELVAVGPNSAPTFAVRRFFDAKSNAIMECDWGVEICHSKRTIQPAIWTLADFLPVLEPYQVPTTWKEMRRVFLAHGDNIDTRLRDCFRLIRDGYQRFLLVGIPVSKRIGEAPSMIHWQPLALPPVSFGINFAKGFRPNDEGYWRRDRRELVGNGETINWQTGKSWGKDDLTIRGRLENKLSDKRIAIIGAGAVGSVLSELMCRAGAHKLTIVDYDDLEQGNLCRHLLDISDLGQNKAVAMATRLNKGHPHSACTAIDARFPKQTQQQNLKLQEADLVIDCTGDDQVTRDLASFAWTDEKQIVSLSLGYAAKRLYFYANPSGKFDPKDFASKVTPFLEQDASEHDGQLLHQGIGCWHSAFPARIDDVWMLTSAGIKLLEAWCTGLSEGNFAVLEQVIDEGGFSGIIRRGAA
ncbi:HesA/MoeB/ThiF family protein [Stieleria varia]|uniref:HesA/MoeB/ThiF family protein n=1 Tax=Stieleria varia TaxID=2528005 RepID=UPI0011B52021|nr:ThiF family adenylyltransferase [Stieleria varia]